MGSTNEVATPLLLGHDTTSSGPSACNLHQSCFLTEGSSVQRGNQQKVQRKLLAACILCFVFLVLEVVGGYLAHSIAILSDAAHMLSDVSSFVVSLFAVWAVTKRSHSAYSFGYHRAEILGALISVLMIWGITGALVWEAVWRVISPVAVNGKLMFIVAAVGVVFNLIIMLVLGEHHTHHGSTCSGHSHGTKGSATSCQGIPRTNTAGGGQHKHDTHQHGDDKCKHQEHVHREHPGSEHHHHTPTQHDLSRQTMHHSHAQGGHIVHTQSNRQHHSKHAHSGHSHTGAAAHDAAHSTCTNHDDHHHHTAHGTNIHPAMHPTPIDSNSDNGPQCITIVAVPSDAPMDVPLPAMLVVQQQACRVQHEHTSACLGPVSSEENVTGSGAAHHHDCGHSHEHSGEHGHSHDHSGEHGHSHDHNGEHGHSHDHDTNINLRGAMIHAVGDLLQSIGVAIAGGLIWWHQDDPRWALADPICTFLFSILVLLTTRAVLRDVYFTLMERSPHSINIAHVTDAMHEIEGILDVHDLHVWNVSMGLPVLTAHVHISRTACPEAVLKQLEQYVQVQLGIRHSTIQICNPLPANTLQDRAQLV